MTDVVLASPTPGGLKALEWCCYPTSHPPPRGILIMHAKELNAKDVDGTAVTNLITAVTTHPLLGSLRYSLDIIAPHAHHSETSSSATNVGGGGGHSAAQQLLQQRRESSNSAVHGDDGFPPLCSWAAEKIPTGTRRVFLGAGDAAQLLCSKVPKHFGCSVWVAKAAGPL
eukprot:PhF_6_TR22211/c0_g1_i2/m.31361